MTWIISKYLITAGLVVLISEVAKRSDKLGALIAALPMVTVLTLIWLYVEKAPSDKISNHAFLTFWYVLPTLPMFLMFPWLLGKFGFWPTLGTCVIITFAFFLLTVKVAALFGVDLA